MNESKVLAKYLSMSDKRYAEIEKMVEGYNRALAGISQWYNFTILQLPQRWG